MFYDGKIVQIEDLKSTPQKKIDLIVDRLIIKHEEDFYNRTADAIEIAFYEGKGTCCLFDLSTNDRLFFSNNFELDGR